MLGGQTRGPAVGARAHAAGTLLPSCFPQAHECLLQLADTITAAEVNALSRSLLSYVSHYRAEAEVHWAVRPLLLSVNQFAMFV